MFKNHYGFLGRWKLRCNKKPSSLTEEGCIIYGYWLGLTCRSEVQRNLRLLGILYFAVSQLISVDVFA